VFSAISDPVLLTALWSGVTATALTAVVGLLIVLLRLNLLREEQQWQDVLALWRPTLLALAIEPATTPLPPLPRRDRRRFLRLWVYLQESVRGEAAERLNAAARELGLAPFALQLLRTGSRTDRLRAILALGHLRDAEAWDALSRTVLLRDPLLSLNAARALLQIDPFRAAQGLVPLAIQREDWDIARMAAFFSHARDVSSLMLSRELPQVPTALMPRALRLARALRSPLPAASLRRIALGQKDPATLRELLPLLQEPQWHGTVLDALVHPDEQVRTVALEVMTRIGKPDDVPFIGGLLRDGAHAIRLAAARTLVGMPFLTDDEIWALAPPHVAGHAELRHAVAERDWQRAA
jgi:HEAT repeat protein